MTDTKQIIVALDFDNQKQVDSLVNQLDPAACRLKVGKELFTHFGPILVENLQHKGFEVFLDLKFHDIPNTVAKAVRAAAELGVWMVNLHALGGRKMMTAAADALSQFRNKPKLIAVTILTSLQNDELKEIGLKEGLVEHVMGLSRLAQNCGLDGVVCSAREAKMIRCMTGPHFSLVTPGIRLADNTSHDQQRVVTPVEAIQNGADYLVIGRSITESQNPLETLNHIRQMV